jgi:hypothetical protein
VNNPASIMDQPEITGVKMREHARLLLGSLAGFPSGAGQASAGLTVGWLLLWAALWFAG